MECPCYVTVTFSGGYEKYVTLNVLDGDEDYSEQIMIDADGQPHELQLPRDILKMFAYSGNHSCMIDSGCAVVPAGSQMDELFVWTDEVSTEAESVNVEAEQTKQYAYVYLAFQYENEVYEDGLMLVESNICGLNLRTLDPIRGEFSLESFPVFGNYYRICVPRQVDASLTGYLSRDGRTLPLGSIIAASGFDWSKKNLDDVYVTINEISTSITVEVVGWEDGSRRKVVI